MALLPSVPNEKSSSPVLRKSYAQLPRILDVPNLIRVQLDSFQRFQEKGVKQLLEEVSRKSMPDISAPQAPDNNSTSIIIYSLHRNL